MFTILSKFLTAVSQQEDIQHEPSDLNEGTCMLSVVSDECTVCGETSSAKCDKEHLAKVSKKGIFQ